MLTRALRLVSRVGMWWAHRHPWCVCRTPELCQVREATKGLVLWAMVRGQGRLPAGGAQGGL